MNIFGLQALIDVVCQIFFVLLAFWAVQGIHFERFLPIQEKQGKVLIVMISIAIGFLCSSFFLSFIGNIKNLTLLF